MTSQGQELPAANLLSFRDIGWLEVGDTRVFLCDAAGGLFTLREQLVREVGGEFQADLFSRAGFASAERLVSTCLANGYLAADEAGLRRALGLMTMGGYGALDLVESRFADRWAVVSCRNTVESSMVRQHGGTSGFVCDYTRGLLRGLLHHLSGAGSSAEPVECAEVSCIANGDSECRFIVGTLSELSAQGYRSSHREFLSVRETLLRLNRQLEDVLEAAQKDPLTGLYNRAYFETALRRRIDFASRRTDTVAVAMIDVDRFKEVNDGQGHGMGDLALQQIARLLASQGRETDVVARYGGDEFALMMPGTSIEAAMIVADRIRQLVASQNIAGNGLTLSIGIASCPADATTLSTLIELADEAMYRAKDSGGNAVRRYGRAGEPPPTPPARGAEDVVTERRNPGRVAPGTPSQRPAKRRHRTTS